MLTFVSKLVGGGELGVVRDGRGVVVGRLGQLKTSWVRTTKTMTMWRRWRRSCKRPACLPTFGNMHNGSSGL